MPGKFRFSARIWRAVNSRQIRGKGFSLYRYGERERERERVEKREGEEGEAREGALSSLDGDRATGTAFQ